MSRDRRRDPPLPRLIVGLTVLAAGVIFWLDRSGSIDAGDYLQWWPLVAIALGLAHVPYRKWVPAAWWLLIGVYFLLPLVGIPRTPLRYVIGLWPLLISVGGATLIRQALRHSERDFSAVAVMGGNVQKIGSQHLRGGDAVVVMGGCELDFGNAKIDGEASIDVLAFWGGLGIKVPPGWEVVSKTALILGGLVANREKPPAGGPRLVIRGSVIMGGIDIRNAAERSA